ncbi:hypothetical protein C8J57DRAFT_1503229 [Mycena rebaudengoi]|nr:hypothetical protein C8J57DRAFT_1503229 [Mycena rebaudengoi]
MGHQPHEQYTAASTSAHRTIQSRTREPPSAQCATAQRAPAIPRACTTSPHTLPAPPMARRGVPHDKYTHISTCTTSAHAERTASAQDTAHTVRAATPTSTPRVPPRRPRQPLTSPPSARWMRGYDFAGGGGNGEDAVRPRPTTARSTRDRSCTTRGTDTCLRGVACAPQVGRRGTSLSTSRPRSITRTPPPPPPAWSTRDRSRRAINEGGRRAPSAQGLQSQRNGSYFDTTHWGAHRHHHLLPSPLRPEGEGAVTCVPEAGRRAWVLKARISEKNRREEQH